MKTETVNTAHTPGPWRAEYATTLPGETVLIWGADESVVLRYGQPSTKGDRPNLLTKRGLANARLIAAAPELLALVKESFDWACNENNDQQWIDRLDAAIAKAEGRA